MPRAGSPIAIVLQLLENALLNPDIATGRESLLVERIAKQVPIILAMWHGQHLLTPFLRPKDVPTKVLISLCPGDGHPLCSSVAEALVFPEKAKRLGIQVEREDELSPCAVATGTGEW